MFFVKVMSVTGCADCAAVPSNPPTNPAKAQARETSAAIL
jgi:hypothetical protein